MGIWAILVYWRVILQQNLTKKTWIKGCSTKRFEVPRTSSMVDTRSIFSPLVLELKADVPTPVGFHLMIVIFWLVGWLAGWLVGVQVIFSTVKQSQSYTVIWMLSRKKGDIYGTNIKTKNITKIPIGGDFLQKNSAMLSCLVPVSAPHKYCKVYRNYRVCVIRK